MYLYYYTVLIPYYSKLIWFHWAGPGPCAVCFGTPALYSLLSKQAEMNLVQEASHSPEHLCYMVNVIFSHFIVIDCMQFCWSSEAAVPAGGEEQRD